MKQSYLENGGTIVSGSEYRDVRTVKKFGKVHQSGLI